MKRKVCTDQEEDLQQPKFEICWSELMKVDVYKYLGLHIDSSLSFQNHHKKMISCEF